MTAGTRYKLDVLLYSNSPGEDAKSFVNIYQSCDGRCKEYINTPSYLVDHTICDLLVWQAGIQIYGKTLNIVDVSRVIIRLVQTA